MYTFFQSKDNICDTCAALLNIGLGENVFFSSRNLSCGSFRYHLDLILIRGVCVLCRLNSKVCTDLPGWMGTTNSHYLELNMDLFRNTLKPVEQILRDAKVKRNEIDDIVLVGGSTHIPK